MLDILQSIPDERQDDFQLTCEHLDGWFGDNHTIVTPNLVQKPAKVPATETVQDFSTDPSRLVRLAFPTAPLEILVAHPLRVG